MMNVQDKYRETMMGLLNIEGGPNLKDRSKMQQSTKFHYKPKSKGQVDAKDVVLHAFDWSYQLVGERADQIARIGYKAVLVSPPMKSLASASGTPWWQRYQPQDYRVIDNQLGDTNDFKSMVSALSQVGLLVYVDVVFNHMANESNHRSDLHYPSARDLKHYQQHPKRYDSLRLFGDLTQPLFDATDFVEAFGIQDWKDTWQVQNGRITGGPHDQGLPKLLVNQHVITEQRQYLLAMKALGVKGFRIDAAKHMTLEHLKAVWSDDITQDVHIFGEIITDGGASHEEYKLFLEPYLKETRLGAYDFPLFQTVFTAFKEGGTLSSLVDPYCFGEALSKARAITFVITHDIPNNDVFKDLVMDESLEWLAYSYILGRDGGVPLIYADLGPSKMVNKLGAPRWKDQWQMSAMAARIEFHNLMHGLPMVSLLVDDASLVFARGDQGIVFINKSAEAKTVTVDWPYPMRDLLSHRIFVPFDNQLTLEIGAKESYLLCHHQSQINN
jgi:alpha-amylase